MRTTLNIPEHLLVLAKHMAADEKTSVSALIADSLRLYLQHAGERRPSRRPRVLPVFRGGRARRGIDVTDTSALLEIE